MRELEKMPCEHTESSEQVVDVDYFGLVFSTPMEVCTKCGAFLWTQESKDHLNTWLAEQKKNNRDHFVIQAAISNNAKACIDEIAKNYPGLATSTLIRAMTSVFLFFMEQPEYSQMFESVTDSDVYQSFQHGEKHVTKVQFSPSGMMDVHSWAKLLHLKPSKVVEEAICRMTGIYVDADPQLKNFWETVVFPQIALILKSAA